MTTVMIFLDYSLLDAALLQSLHLMNYDRVGVVLALPEGVDVPVIIRPLLPVADDFYCIAPEGGAGYIRPGDLADELKHHTYPPQVHSFFSYEKGLVKLCENNGDNEAILVVAGQDFLEVLKKRFLV